MNTIRSAAEERPPAELAMDYPESLLNKAPAALFRPAIVRLYRAMLNITLNQHDPKYFRLKTDNSVVRDEILACPGGLALLEAVGFQREGEAASKRRAPGEAWAPVKLRSMRAAAAR
mgnify:CR=1 FL=1